MEENAVERAVRIVGGPSQASHVCDVSYWAVRMWRKNGIVPDTRAAILLSRASGVAVEELAGMATANGGPGPSQGRRFRRGGSGITTTYPVPSPSPADEPQPPVAASLAA